MKITRLTTWQAAPRWLFLRIDTDEGVSGWGEPVIEGRAATVEAATTLFDADTFDRVSAGFRRSSVLARAVPSVRGMLQYHRYAFGPTD